ncbi:MAG: glycosyltransferase family 4 protein [Nitrospirota bacterium]|nr:glycosyltransferase family 4 protein [Nitrospirota bacterium]
MKILLAAWHLKDFNVGLGRYVRCLIEALGAVDRDNEYEIVMPVGQPPFTPHPNIRYRTVRIPIFKRRVWEQVVPWLCDRHDILHLPYDSCVIRKRGKLVVTIHDVKPLLFNTGRYTRPLLERFLVPDRRAVIDHVVTVSTASSLDIQRLLGFPAQRMTVIYPGVDLQRFRPTDASNKIDSPYVLAVTGADPTKNMETLIQAFARLPLSLREGHKLILAGDLRRRPELGRLIEELGIGPQTVFAGIVSDDQLIELYQHAAVFVFPSRYEGFGLPVLEAMACGCPVICSNASSLPEVAGHAALLVDPTDVEGFAQDMERVLTDAALRQSMRERGLAQAAQFPWERTARETIAVYQNVLSQT